MVNLGIFAAALSIFISGCRSGNSFIIGSSHRDVNLQPAVDQSHGTSTSPAFFHLDTVAFFEAGKAEHACHKLFLLVVASGYTKYVPAI